MKNKEKTIQKIDWYLKSLTKWNQLKKKSKNGGAILCAKEKLTLELVFLAPTHPQQKNESFED